MKIAMGSDGKSALTDSVIREVKARGHEVDLFGALVNDSALWPKVAHSVAQEVASGKAHQGILFCWTGTGISIAANKVPGIRAALCIDAETAKGARAWNDANVLALSLRATSEQVAKEILEAWFSTPASKNEDDQKCFDYLRGLDRKPLSDPHED